MRRISVLGAAALLAVLPAATHAQSTSQEVVVRENTTVVVKEAPKPSPVTFTPYGFFVLNAFFNDSLGNRNYPLPAPCTGGASCEGNILFDVRQTRLGSRLVFNDTAGWTKARLSALVEVDFQGGYTTASTTALASSIAFYSPVLRLRKAYADATWGGFTLRIGQDDHIVSLLRPVSVAYIANPLFQFAGTLNGRAPMIEARYDINPKDGLAFNAQVAAVAPMDNTAGDDVPSPPSAAVDLGAGNRSRVPAWEARLAVGFKTGGKKLAELSGWGGWQKNRFVSPATDTNVDVNSYIVGGDLTLNVWMVNVLGSIYSAKGWDQPGSLGASQGIALTVAADPLPARHNGLPSPNASAVPALGGWFQVLVGPYDLVQGLRRLGRHAEPGRRLHRHPPRQRNRQPAVQNFQWAAGLIGYAGKNWRFSAEYSRATSFFYTGSPQLPRASSPSTPSWSSSRGNTALDALHHGAPGSNGPGASSFGRPSACYGSRPVRKAHILSRRPPAAPSRRSKKMKRILSLAVAALLAVPALAASQVKIGVINSMTGPQAPIGENLTNGIKLAEEDLAAKGIKVQLVWEDDTGKPQVGLSAMDKLATRDNVAGVVGAYTSAVTNAVAKKAEQYKVPLVNPVASKEEITRQGYKYVFRVSATTGDYAAILLDMATTLGKPKTIAILSENTDFGVSGAKSAKEIAEKKGIKVVFEEAYSPGSPDYRSTLVKVKGANPDLMFMVSYVADAITLMRQSRELQLTPMAFLGAGAGFSTDKFASEKNISHGVFSSTQWTPDVNWPGAKAFGDRYDQALRQDPRPTTPPTPTSP